MRNRVGVMVAVLAACGGGKDDEEQASLFRASTSEITKAMSAVMQSADKMESSPGVEGIKHIGALAKEAIGLSKHLAAQKRMAVTGGLKACADGWYKAADELKDALVPFVDVASKGLEDGKQFEFVANLQNAWQSKDAESKLCQLKDAAKACSPTLKAYDLPLPTKTCP